MKIVKTIKTAMLAMMAGMFVLFPAAPLAAQESPAARPHPHGSLVIVLTTGLEDMQAVNRPDPPKRRNWRVRRKPPEFL